MKKVLLIILVCVLIAGFLAGLYFLLPFGDGPEAASHRLITTVVVGALIVLAIAVWWVRRLLASIKFKAAVSGEEADDEAQDDYDDLVRQFQRAVATLGGGRSGVRSSLALYRLPWFMLIGPPNAGKSTALRVSGLRFPRSQAVQGVGGTRNCDWWFSPDAIFLDTAGRYASEFEDEAEWHAFLELLYKHRRRRPIDGLLIAVGMDALQPLGPGELDELADTLRERVLDIYTHLRSRVPLLLLVTKVDLLEGFDSAFGQLDPRVRERAWGFPFPDAPATPDRFAQALEDRFEALEARVERHLVQRAVGVRSPSEVEQVAAFRRSLSRAAAMLARFTSRLAEPLGEESTPYLAGVYLLSSQTGDQGALPAADRVERRFGVPWSGRFDGVPVERPEGPWFVRQLFKKVIVQKLAALYHRRAHTAAVRKAQVAVIAATFVGVAFLSGAMGSGFQHVRSAVDSARQAYLGLKYAPAEQGSRGSLAALESLEALRHNLEMLGAIHLHPGNFEVMTTRLDQIYAAKLKRAILDPVARRLEQQLVLASRWTPEDDTGDFRLFERYYQILETGLALAGGGCYRKDFGLASRLEQEWKRAMGVKDVSAYSRLFADAADRVGKPNGVPWMTLDERLVASARAGLARADLATRAYQRVVGQLTLAAPPVLNLKVTEAPRIDGLYQEQACRAFEQALSSVSLEGDRDCVLNLEVPAQARDRKALWAQYQRRYGAFWQNWLNHWTLREPPRSLAGIETVLATLADARESDLVEVFKHVGGADTRSIELPGGVSVSASTLSKSCEILVSRFAPYALMVDPNAKKPAPGAAALTDLLSALDLLRLKLGELTEDSTATAPVTTLVVATVNGDSELTRALDAARKFEHSVGPGSPLVAERVRAFVQRLVADIWILVRARVQEHLDEVWRRDVWTRWRDLETRYPFAADSPNSVSCSQVEVVMGASDSLLSHFVDTDLGPFLEDSSASRVEAKKGRLGPALLLSGDFVDALERIRTTFGRVRCLSDAPEDAAPVLAPGSRSNRVSAVRFESAGGCWTFRMSSRAVASCTSLGDGVTLGVVVGSGPRAVSRTLYHFEGPWAFERLLEAAQTELRNKRSYCWKTSDGDTASNGWEATIWLEFPRKVFEDRMSVDVLRRLRLPRSVFDVPRTGG